MYIIYNIYGTVYQSNKQSSTPHPTLYGMDGVLSNVRIMRIFCPPTPPTRACPPPTQQRAAPTQPLHLTKL